MDFLDQIFLGNTIEQWLIAAAIIAGACILLRLLQSLVVSRLKKYSARTSSSFDDLLAKLIAASLMPLLYIWAFYFGLQTLNFGERADRYLNAAMMVASAFFTIRAITSLVSWTLHRAAARQQGSDSRKQVEGILLIIKGVIWLIGILFLVDNLGYDITTIVAGLGIGGIAIALAAQTVLGDLFSYFVIFFDKPFTIGDFIIVDDKLGTIEYIGIKTTRIRTLSGEQLICSNTDLTNSRVHNYKRMHERRVVFSFSLPQDVTPEVLQNIPVQLRQIVRSLPDTRFDRAHFSAFGPYSLNFEVVYYVLSPDYNVYMDRQQAINLEILRYFREEGIRLAVPLQEVNFKSHEEKRTTETQRTRSFTV